MRKNTLKIKLISVPGLDPLMPKILYMPFGISTISSLLKRENYEVIKEDLNVSMINNASRLFHLKNIFTIQSMRNPEKLSEHLFQKSYHYKFEEYITNVISLENYKDFDVFGLSALSHEALIFALLFAQLLRRNYPDKIIVLGGAYLSIIKDRYFNKLPYIDFIIHGRGDYPMLKLMDYLSHGKGNIEHIDGLIYRDGKGHIYVNKAYDDDLNEEPIPDYDGFDFDSYKGYLEPELGKDGYNLSIPYRTNIGCVRRCNFCDYRRVHGSYKEKDVDKIVNEAEILSKKYKSPYFHLVDSALNNNPKKLQEFCLKLLERKLNLRWHGYMRATNISKKLLQLMKQAGAFHLRWGIESGNSEVLKYIGKGYNRAQAIEALDLAYEVGFKNTILIIIGEPYERINHVQDTLSLLKRYVNNKNINYHIYNLKLISDSPLFIEPEKFNIKNIHPIGHTNSNFIYFNRTGYQYDETYGLKWEDRRKLTIKLSNYFFDELYKAEKEKGVKKGLPISLYVWRRNLLEESYLLCYIFQLVMRKQVKYVS